MPTTVLVEIVNITGLSLYRNLQMLSTYGVCALESSSLNCIRERRASKPQGEAERFKAHLECTIQINHDKAIG